MEIEEEKITRLTVQAPIAERAEVITYLFKQKYRIMKSGPLPLGGGKFDTAIYYVIAEKVDEKS